jgi:hypothetical protein
VVCGGHGHRGLLGFGFNLHHGWRGAFGDAGLKGFVTQAAGSLGGGWGQWHEKRPLGVDTNAKKSRLVNQAAWGQGFDGTFVQGHENIMHEPCDGTEKSEFKRLRLLFSGL